MLNEKWIQLHISADKIIAKTQQSIDPRCMAYLSKFGDKIAETKVAIPHVGAYGDSQLDPTVNFQSDMEHH